MFTIVGKHLMGAGEIGDRLGGVSRQRVQQIISKPTFPTPYDELQMGKVWLIADVEAWIRAHRQDLVDEEAAPPAASKPLRTKGNRTPRKSAPRQD
jgi:prophage regulatory protein